jgi:5-(carboxyamino)imidazole ribonucleotide synthase
MILSPGATIGILGAGQLGRMLAIAALKLGLRTQIFDPEEAAPAYDAAVARTIAAFDDEALTRFAEAVDVVTFEFENVPTSTLEFLAERVTVHQGARALALTQDRLTEKTFLRELGFRVAPFVDVEDAQALVRAVAEIGRPAILKTRRFGYDGKGQSLIREGSNVAAVHRTLGSAPMILEGFVAFEREVSVIAGRSLEGETAAYDLCENEHERHILARTRVPARMSADTAAEAKRIGASVLEALDYVGVLAVEMFVTAITPAARR